MSNSSLGKHNFFKTNKFIALSFLLPIIIMGSMFAAHGIFPAGDRQILVADFWQQYYQFFSDFWHKLRTGGLSEWSWSTGIGTNYAALVSYYLASPLNLLLGIFPHHLLREAITLMLLIKIGFSGMFCSLFLRYSFNRNDISLAIFSSFYALCAFSMGYYWNIMWLDSFALLPLIALGVRSLVYEGRWRLYVASLGLSMLCNYYIGYFSCLFVVVIFVLFTLVKGVSKKEFVQKFLKIAGVSVVAIGLSAVSLLPTLFALSRTYSSFEPFPKSIQRYEKFLDIVGNFTAFSSPTVYKGLPNIYAGMLCVVLAAMFFTSKSIKLKEKLGYGLVLSGLIVSCNIKVLNYIWHGFHFTNMIPYRFSFLISFVLIIMAYRAFTLIEEMSKFNCLWAFLISGVVIFAAYLGPQNYIAKAGSLLLIIIYVLLLELYRRGKMRRSILLCLIFIISFFELLGNTFIGIESVQTTSRSEYPTKYSDVQTLLEKQRENSTDIFSRIEMVRWYTINDPSLYKYNGVSLFSSTINAKTTTFLRHLGLMSWENGNRYSYAETSPLANAFLGVNHLISLDGKYADTKHWEQTQKSGESLLLQNRYPLSVGFMAENSLSEFSPLDSQGYFDMQNDLFTKSTGLSDMLYSKIDIIHVDHKNLLVTRSDQGKYKYEQQNTKEPSTFQWNYTLPEDGQMYAYLVLKSGDDVDILHNGEMFYQIRGHRPYIFCAGEGKKGDIVSIRTLLPFDIDKSGDVEIHAAMFNEDAFTKGMPLLADEQMEITNLSGSSLSGKITANKAGLLYLSVPYEKGWKAFVDGKEQQILPLNNSMITLPLEQGTHEITINYRTQGLRPGIGISITSLIIFILLIFWEQKRTRNFNQQEAESTISTPVDES